MSRQITWWEGAAELEAGPESQAQRTRPNTADR